MAFRADLPGRYFDVREKSYAQGIGQVDASKKLRYPDLLRWDARFWYVLPIATSLVVQTAVLGIFIVNVVPLFSSEDFTNIFPE